MQVGCIAAWNELLSFELRRLNHYRKTRSSSVWLKIRAVAS